MADLTQTEFDQMLAAKVGQDKADPSEPAPVPDPSRETTADILSSFATPDVSSTDVRDGLTIRDDTPKPAEYQPYPADDPETARLIREAEQRLEAEEERSM